MTQVSHDLLTPDFVRHVQHLLTVEARDMELAMHQAPSPDSVAAHNVAVDRVLIAQRLADALEAPKPPRQLDVRADGAVGVHERWVHPPRRSMERAARMAAMALVGGTNAAASGFSTAGAARMALSRLAHWLRDELDAGDLAGRVESLQVDRALRVRVLR